MKKWDMFVNEKYVKTVNNKKDVKNFLVKNSGKILNVVEYTEYGINHIWNINGGIPEYFNFSGEFGNPNYE